MIPERVSRYRILEEIGSGGMGVVYRARDERLDREVAVKILKPPAAQDESLRKRFRQEATALSRLSHPYINTVFDFDSADGLDFLVLELVEGRRLEDLLTAGAVAERDTLLYGAQIAAALAAAHEAGVVHRDLKPGNVIVTAKGSVKLLDFGLALLRPGAAAMPETRSLTEAGFVVGTLGYMAPEQLLGHEVTGRSDLYSLGVLLYEMTSGRRPFTATPAAALIDEILNRRPVPPLLPGGPLDPRFESLILALLEKEPRRRPESADEVEAALRAILTAPASSGARAAASRSSIGSIAVLPLENLSGDPEQEFFADGMTEALILTLAQIDAFRVASRTSVMRFKGTRLPLPEIARALQVDAVVEGTVARFGGRVRVTAQLIDAGTDRHLWARSYERELSDVLALQGEVARAVAEEIRGQVTREASARLARARRVDPEAYEAYLRGRYHWNRRSEEGIRKGIEHFEEAIRLDPLYAQAHAGLAQAYDTLGSYSFITPEEAYTKARIAALHALEIDENLSEAHVAMGGVLQNHLWDWAGSEEHFRRALAADPGNAGAYHWYSDLLSALGRSDEAVAAMRRAHELDPLSLTVNMSLGACFFYARRYDDAVEQQRRTLDLDPNFAPAHRMMGGALEQLGRLDDAMAEYRTAAALSKDLSANALLAHTLARAGRPDEARRVHAQLRADAEGRYLSPYSEAAIYTGLGETDAAFERLEKAYAIRDRGMVWIKVAPRLDPLRGDPRFDALLERMNLTRDRGRDGTWGAKA
ncbi:MAG TPA: protein kinase [Candidatus Eisenbacteria bacterium]|nr:protein kinase [Candidatus Eisenbacteria bacterium]